MCHFDFDNGSRKVYKLEQNSRSSTGVKLAAGAGMYTLSRKVDYAFRAVEYMALKPPGQVVHIKEIAEHRNIPKDFLSKIMRDLVNHKIVRSRFGPGGGYCLNRSPAEISFKDIVEAVDGPVNLLGCDDGAEECPFSCTCGQQAVWRELQGKIIETLDQYKMKDFCQTVKA